MTLVNIEQYVKDCIERMQQEDQKPVAVMLGHEDWIEFTVQSQVAYTPFGLYEPYVSRLRYGQNDASNRCDEYDDTRR